MAVKANITVIRPQLTPEEREKRMNDLKEAVRRFWINVERQKQSKEQKV